MTEPFTEDEAFQIAHAIRETIDQPRRKTDPATKTILFDFFGTSNSGKTTATENIERLFRRAKYRVLCPQETAEIPEIRSQSTASPVVFQARHLTGVSNYVLNLAENRNYHMAIISRGCIDMLYWYERGRREGTYSEQHVAGIRQWLLETLRLNLVDAYVFFTCRPEVAIEREYAKSVTKKRGSQMNEHVLTEAHEIYASILDEVERNVLGLPLFRIDTSDLDVRSASEEVLRQVLPHLCARFDVPGKSYLTKSLSLLRKQAAQTQCFEEQLKLIGHAMTREQLVAKGWTYLGSTVDEDIYLDPSPDTRENNSFDEIIRIRKQPNKTQFMFKSQAPDRIFSHRQPITLEISPEEAEEIRRTYPTLTTMVKERERFRLDSDDPNGHFFIIHLDTIKGLGKFTEIRSHGSQHQTHSKALLEIATGLGHTPADMIEGSYLGLLLGKR